MVSRTWRKGDYKLLTRTSISITFQLFLAHGSRLNVSTAVIPTLTNDINDNPHIKSPTLFSTALADWH